MKHFIAATLVSLSFTTPLAAQQAPEENENVYGRWEFTAENGMHGSVVMDRGFCHYTVSSAFSFMQSNCVAAWRGDTNTLIIVPLQGSTTKAFTVPDYQPRSGAVSATRTIAEYGEQALRFQMTRFGVRWMRGHLLGAGDHVTVTLRKH